jgi:hypothetical protein
MDGVLAHHQPLGDLPVRETLGEVPQHLTFACGDLRVPRAIAGADRTLEQPAGALRFGVGPEFD